MNQHSSEGVSPQNRDECLHPWHRCYHCKTAPIVGIRYHCDNVPEGPDSDLCSACHQLYLQGKVKSPADVSYGQPSGETPRFVVAPIPTHPVRHEWLDIPHPAVAAPAVEDGFIVRPEFCSGYESSFGGYSFVIQVPETKRWAVLTALHVMDEMIRKKAMDCTLANRGYTGRELPAVITKVNLYDIFAANWMLADLGSAGPMMVMPEARIQEEEPYADLDIAAFWVQPRPGLRAATLAAETPAVGEPVWLVSKHKHGTDRVQKAVVVETTPRTFIYKFESPEEGPRYTSGSPLLNGAGEVVALNVGGGRFRGARLGHANHVANIRRHLSQAIALDGKP